MRWMRVGGLLVGLVMSGSVAALNYAHETELAAPSTIVNFGFSADRDGDFIVVGDPGNNSAVVYKRNLDGSWSVHQEFTSPISDTSEFGYAVAVDGDTMVITDKSADFLVGTTRSGVFHRYKIDTNQQWIYQGTHAIPVSETSLDSLNYDGFGTQVALEGGVMVVTAPDDSGPTNIFKQGTAYLYQKDSQGLWKFNRRLVAPTPIQESYFGTSVATDGVRVIVGAKDSDINSTLEVGRAYIYTVSDAKDSQVAVLDAPEPRQNLWYGAGVDIAGEYAFVGAPGYYTGGEAGAGRLYPYQLDSTAGAWGMLMAVDAPAPAYLDGFGWGIDFDGSDLLVSGSEYADRLYLYRLDTAGTAFGSVRDWQVSNYDALSHGDGLGKNALHIDSGHVLAASSYSNEVFLFEPEVALNLVLQDDTDPVDLNTPFGYSIHVTNNDPEVMATKVKVSGTLPSGLRVANTASWSSGCIYDAQRVSCTFDSVATYGGSDVKYIQLEGTVEGTHSVTMEASAEQWLSPNSQGSDTETSSVVAATTSSGSNTEQHEESGGGSMGWLLMLGLLLPLLRRFGCRDI